MLKINPVVPSVADWKSSTVCSILCAYQLCLQLVTDSSVGGNEWLEVVSDVHTTISSLQSLHTKLDSLSLQVQGTGLSGQPWQEAGLVAEGVAKLVEQVEELEQLQCYLTWICHISKLRSVM